MPHSPMPIVAGDPWPILALRDQHDQGLQIDQEIRLLIFTADKVAADLAESALADQTAASLAVAGIRLVADISPMPAMVTKLFALPKLRQRPYPVGLAYRAAETAALPRQPGQATVLEGREGRVVACHFIGAVAALRQRLGLS